VLVRKAEPKAQLEFSEDYIQARWLLFLRWPGRDTRDDARASDLGEVGAIRAKNWTKATPYGPARVPLADGADSCPNRFPLLSII
jgi:hypothetical protein